MSINHLVGASLDDLVRGYRIDETGKAHCLFCPVGYEGGEIHHVDGRLLLADKAAEVHVETVHHGAFLALASLGADAAGLPEAQFHVLSLLGKGMDDAQIAKELGGKSASTVRNHRFHLRKREEEARIFLALMRLLDERGSGPGQFLEYPAGMPAADERAAVTETEAAAIESRYCAPRSGNLSRKVADDGGGAGMAAESGPVYVASPASPSAESGEIPVQEGGFHLTSWPKRQKEKLVLLRKISGLFQEGRRYRETEVNAILGPVWSDHVTIRRYLIEYRFLSRKPDGSEYWKT